VRVETTGGGGWGDPLEREPELVALDVREGKVSARAARERYGVVLAGSDETPEVAGAATRALRDQLRPARGRQPFFDRGPGYRTLAGVDHAEVDFVDSA
jgi:N-methylhydantoinase B